jgi:heme oxygenase (biliverdin-IX-beta and delta-forming)
MFMQRLKQQTQSYHSSLEDKLDLLNPALTREQYRLLLQRFWGFYAPLEERLQALHFRALYPFDAEKRRKVPLLRNDLQTLGLTEAEIRALPRCVDLPDCRHYPQVLGCWYVIEGATLGGQLISRHFRAVLGMSREQGCAFFGSYGEQVGSMWKEFCSGLNAAASIPAVESLIIESACQTFIALDRWLLRSDDHARVLLSSSAFSDRASDNSPAFASH